MQQNSYTAIIKEQMNRALWEVRNIIDCIPDELWDKEYCEMPMWKHVYHMLHSLDLWFINPRDQHYTEPPLHEKDLNNLNVKSLKRLTRMDIEAYYENIKTKIAKYLETLQDEDLLSYPPNCKYTKITLILGQIRHLNCHMGMIMGFIIDDIGKWPRVLGLEGEFPTGRYDKYF